MEETISQARATDRRIWVILLIVGLLMTEYTLQSMYYDRMRRNAKAGFFSKGFKLDAISVPKSTEYIQEHKLNQCHFPIFYDSNRFEFNLKEFSYIQIGDWRAANKKLHGGEDRENTHNSLKRSEWFRKKTKKTSKKHLPPIRRNVTFIHVGKLLDTFDQS